MKNTSHEGFAAVHLRRGSEMITPEDVTAMVRLKELGWGTKRIARELKVSKNTVKKHVRAGGYVPYKQPERPKVLDGLDGWLREPENTVPGAVLATLN